MLYVTTRTPHDTFTAAHALDEYRPADGGFFAPMRLPVFSAEEIAGLKARSFSQNTAEIVNLLFGSRLDGWSVEFAIGRYPVKYANVGNRTLVAELWHNPAWRFERLARGIEKAIRQSDQIQSVPSDWLLTGARIAVLFGVFGDLLRSGGIAADAPIDVVVPSGDFSAPMACLYAREMGLPIHNVLCSSNENSACWNLIHKGELRTENTVTPTDTPLCDYAVPFGLERLIFHALGIAEARAFAEHCEKGKTYYLEPHQLQALRQGLYAAVVSRRQMEAAVTSLYGSYGYLADPYTALCVGGIGSYRSKTGESRTALILSEECPVHHLNVLARCLGTDAATLKKAID